MAEDKKATTGEHQKMPTAIQILCDITDDIALYKRFGDSADYVAIVIIDSMTQDDVKKAVDGFDSRELDLAEEVLGALPVMYMRRASQFSQDVLDMLLERKKWLLAAKPTSQ